MSTIKTTLSARPHSPPAKAINNARHISKADDLVLFVFQLLFVLHDSGIYEPVAEGPSVRALSNVTARHSAHLKANFGVLDYLKFYDPVTLNLM